MLILNSYAKLNLFLEVLNKRKDTYHNISTLFERIGLHDTVILKPRRDKKITLACNSPDIPCDESNLAYRGAKLLQDTFKINQGVDIKLIKRIPAGAGLGGGSSNAASALSGLNKLWKLNLNQNALARLAKKIGCDVPFFIYDTPFALGKARGDRIKPLKALSKVRLWHILVVPKIKALTPLMYKKWDSLMAEGRAGLTRPKYNVNILISALRENDPSLMGEALFNSLEQVTLKLYPKILRIKRKLLHLAVKSILMSGSGPAVFGVVSSRKEAELLGRQLKEEAKKNFWQVFVTQTL